MNLLTRDIILTGFMGTGKTVVGRKLAELLNRVFIDTDNEVEGLAHKSVASIFAEQGEAAFRRQETDAIKGLNRYPLGSLVIATGGGAVLREENYRFFRERGVIILLTASADEIFRRVGHTDRPLLKSGDARKRVGELLQEREPTYRKTAHISVDTEGKTPEEVAREIMTLPYFTRNEPPLQG